MVVTDPGRQGFFGLLQALDNTVMVVLHDFKIPKQTINFHKSLTYLLKMRSILSKGVWSAK